MIDDRVSSIARDAGASCAEPLPPSELVEFHVDHDGRLSVVTAGGERLKIARRSDLADGFDPGSALTTERAVRTLLPDVIRHGGWPSLGVRFFRRAEIICGERIVRFVEAGR